MTVEMCALCEHPMNPGQRRAELDDGRKAHSLCASLANTTVGIPELERVWSIDDAQAVAELKAVVAAVVDERMTDAVAKATSDAIASKANALRDLMVSAAKHLDRGLEEEIKKSYPSMTAVVAMVKAAAVLRTVAIYIRDEVPTEDRGSMSTSGEGR